MLCSTYTNYTSQVLMHINLSIKKGEGDGREVTKEQKSGAAPLLKLHFPFDVVLITTNML